MSRLLLIPLFFFHLYSCVPIVGVSTVGIVKTSVEIADDPRSLGRIVDDNVIEKKFLFKISQVSEKYLIKISPKSIDGRFLLKGNVDTIQEKIEMTKIAWETDGVRSVENLIKVDDQSSWKDKAKDLLITSQFKVAIVANNNIKSNNFNFTTINKNLYIFGIARDEQERRIVIDEAKSVQGVSEVISSIFLKDDLSNNQRIAN